MLPRTYPLTKAPKNTFLPPIPRTRRAVVRYLFFTALWCFFFGIAYHVFYSERKQGGSDPFLSFLFGSGTEFQPQGVDSPDTLDLWDVWAVQNLLESGGELLHKKVNIYPKDELLGLIYFISSDESNTLPDMLDIDRTLKPIDLGMISDKKGMSAHEWRTRMARLEDAAPLVVFSKTYCQFSRRAKALLKTYNIEPEPQIIEVDLRRDSDLLKALLGRLTGRLTFPNVILRGKSLGGSDDLAALHNSGELYELLKSAGLASHPDRED